jgi:hypothetical protein
VVQDGEHSAYSPWGEHFSADYEKLLLSLKEFPDNPVIITIGIWNPRCRKEFIDCTSPDYDSWARKINSIQEEISGRLGILFASVSAFENDPLNTGDGKVAGVRWHPNDNGMVKYADAAFEKFRQYFKI